MHSPTNSSAPGVPVKYAGFCGGVTRAMSVGDTDGDLLRDTIAAVTDSGDGIMFGRTRDGGALSVSVYSNGKRASAYFVDVDTLQNALIELRQSCSST